MNIYMKKSQGFTLIEVLLAIVILSILIVPLFNFFAQSLYYTKSNQQQTIATYAARNALVFVEKQNFSGFCKELNCNKDACEDCTETTDEIKLNYEYCFDHYELFGIEEESEALETCGSFFKPTINNIEYVISGTITLHENEDFEKYLLPVEIVATWKDIRKENSTQELRGYISEEELRYQPK